MKTTLLLAVLLLLGCQQERGSTPQPGAQGLPGADGADGADGMTGPAGKAGPGASPRTKADLYERDETIVVVAGDAFEAPADCDDETDIVLQGSCEASGSTPPDIAWGRMGSVNATDVSAVAGWSCDGNNVGTTDAAITTVVTCVAVP